MKSLLFFLCLTLAAAGSGTLRLVVKDPTGAPMAVNGKLTSGAWQRDFQTDAAGGGVDLTELPFGRYRIDLSQNGFAQRTFQVIISSTEPVETLSKNGP